MIHELRIDDECVYRIKCYRIQRRVLVQMLPSSDENVVLSHKNAANLLSRLKIDMSNKYVCCVQQDYKFACVNVLVSCNEFPEIKDTDEVPTEWLGGSL